MSENDDSSDTKKKAPLVPGPNASKKTKPKKLYQRLLEPTPFGTRTTLSLTREGRQEYARLQKEKARYERQQAYQDGAPRSAASAGVKKIFNRESKQGYYPPKGKDRDDDLSM